MKNSQENNLTGRQSHWKTISLEDNLTGRQPHYTLYTLSSTIMGSSITEIKTSWGWAGPSSEQNWLARQANVVIFQWGCLHWCYLPLILSSIDVVFYWGDLPSFSIEFVFNWVRLSLSLSSIEVILHWCCLPLRLSSTYFPLSLSSI